MGYIHCCAGLRRSKSYSIKPEEGYLYTQVDYLEECPVCGHSVIQLTRMDKNNQVSICRKTNYKAKKLFNKIKADILFEKNPEKTSYRRMSNFYLYYNDFGKKKKCYSNLSSLKIGLFENKLY